MGSYPNFIDRSPAGLVDALCSRIEKALESFWQKSEFKDEEFHIPHVHPQYLPVSKTESEERDTTKDYPFVQVENNRYYLDRDIDGNYSAAGTIFMDCLCSNDFSDFNTVLYGHHMKNGTMFGSMAQFNDKDFFDTNKTGTVFLADKTFSIDIFAYMIIQADDLVVYESPSDAEGKKTSLEYIRENARHYRDVGVGTEDQIITLSTCAYEFKNARMLLIGKLTRIQ